jgi:hypothetical protein
MVKRFCANTDRFIEFVELCAASKQNGFWLVTLQCLEECCLNPQSSSFTATEQYSQDIALQAVYTLNDLVRRLSRFVDRTAMLKFKSISQLMAEPHLEERFSTVFYSNVLSHVTIFQRDDALISSEKVESKNKQSYQQQIYSSEMESSIVGYFPLATLFYLTFNVLYSQQCFWMK